MKTALWKPLIVKLEVVNHSKIKYLEVKYPILGTVFASAVPVKSTTALKAGDHFGFKSTIS